MRPRYGPLIGYFTEAAQVVPEYDPPHDGPCIVCMEPLTAGDIRTHNLMWGDKTGDVSVFYRSHRTCAESTDMGAYDGSVLDVIAHA